MSSGGGFTEAAHHQPPRAGSAHLALPAAGRPEQAEKWACWLGVWLGGGERGGGGANSEGWDKEQGAGAVVGRRG